MVNGWDFLGFSLCCRCHPRLGSGVSTVGREELDALEARGSNQGVASGVLGCSRQLGGSFALNNSAARVCFSIEPCCGHHHFRSGNHLRPAENELLKFWKWRSDMGNKLNPNGAKIRNLRMQRGWTQEQLAEIADVSARTIQRAEAANRAAFETIRAIAGAFETDFDQLLETGTRGDLAPKPQPYRESYNSAFADYSGQPGRHAWRTLQAAAAAAVIGLLAGVFFTYRPSLPQGPNSVATGSAVASNTAVTAPAGTLQKTDLSQVGALPSPAATQVALRTGTGMVRVPRLPVRAAKAPGYRPSVATVAKTFAPADVPVPTGVNLSTGSGGLDLPLETRARLSTLPIPEVAIEWSASPISQAGPSQIAQNTGAVRLAMALAGKKSGAFFSKVSASMKRVF